jgi:uncharacterized protein (TIGR00297 family)
MMGMAAAAGLGTMGVTPARLWLALLITVAFAVLAYLVRAVDVSGAVVGFILTFILFGCGGPGAFAAVATVFGLAWLSTRFGYRRKQDLGTAEKRSGRTASQIAANLAVAAIAAMVAMSPKWRWLGLGAAAAALAEAAADTVSSEIGQSTNSPVYLITNWKLVVPGTDGGISLAGSLAGMAGSVLVGVVCNVTHLLGREQAAIAIAAGVLGMFADSYLGAILERRGLLGNDTVNFLSTLIAAIAATILAAVLT